MHVRIKPAFIQRILLLHCVSRHALIVVIIASESNTTVIHEGRASSYMECALAVGMVGCGCCFCYFPVARIRASDPLVLPASCCSLLSFLVACIRGSHSLCLTSFALFQPADVCPFAWPFAWSFYRHYLYVHVAFRMSIAQNIVKAAAYIGIVNFIADRCTFARSVYSIRHKVDYSNGVCALSCAFRQRPARRAMQARAFAND
jgi:hypothetical protein